jgi:hypothetical protein
MVEAGAYAQAEDRWGVWANVKGGRQLHLWQPVAGEKEIKTMTGGLTTGTSPTYAHISA